MRERDGMREKTVYLNGQISHTIWWDEEHGCWISSRGGTWRRVTVLSAGITQSVWRSNDGDEATDGPE